MGTGCRQAKESRTMKRLINASVLAVALLFSTSAFAEDPPNARAQDARGYSYGPVTEVKSVHVEYGHFDEYMAWVTSTWVPIMEAEKRAGLIVGYRVFQASPRSPDDANMYLEITFRNMAAYAGDLGDQADAFEAVLEHVICNNACQNQTNQTNQTRVHLNEIRRLLGTEVTRELIFSPTMPASR